MTFIAFYSSASERRRCQWNSVGGWGRRQRRWKTQNLNKYTKSEEDNGRTRHRLQMEMNGTHGRWCVVRVCFIALLCSVGSGENKEGDAHSAQRKRQFKVEQILNFIKNLKKNFSIWYFSLDCHWPWSMAHGKWSVRWERGSTDEGCTDATPISNGWINIRRKYISEFDIYLASALALRLRFAICIKCKVASTHTHGAFGARQ